MAYSDLVIKATIEKAADCSQAIIKDDTGFFPASAGGYAEYGEGTAKRPEYIDVHLFFVLRVWYPDGTFNDFYPETQPDKDPYPSTVEWSFLDEFGLPSPDQTYQGFWVVAPADTTFEAALILAETDGVSLVEYAQVNWGVGTFDVSMLCFVNNCKNDAMIRLNKAFKVGECQTSEFELKSAMLQGINSNIVCAQAAPVLSASQAAYYTEAQKEIETLVGVCNDPECKCNIC